MAVLNPGGINLCAAPPADKSTQILPWVKYLATIVPPALQRLKNRTGGTAPPPITQQQRSWLTAIGLLDLVAYTLFSLAYFSCGAALSNLLLAACGQVLTALSTVLFLKQRLTRGQWLGISLIVAGLAMRAAPSGGGGGSNGGVALSREQWVGVGMILGAACLYTAVGLLYERLTKGVAKPPPHTEVMWHTSKLGRSGCAGGRGQVLWDRSMHLRGHSTAHFLGSHPFVASTHPQPR